jgi:hypothetical protein
VARGPPDHVRRNKQVAGPTEATDCESVVITRIQFTPKSFRVDRGDFVVLQAMSHAWRTAQLKTTVRVHQRVRRRKADAYARGARMMKKVWCKATKSHCTQSAGTVGSVRRSGRNIPWITKRWVRAWVQDVRSRVDRGDFVPEHLNRASV